MFIRVKRTPNSAKTAVQLVENIREHKRVKQKIVRHFGYALNEDEIDSLKKLAEHYKIELEQKSMPVLFAKENILSLVEAGARKAETDLSPLHVNLRDIVEEKRMRIGIHQAYGKLFDLIGFGSVLANPSRRKASVSLLRNIVMARIAKPVSKRSSVMMLEQEYGITADVNAVYRMMSMIDETAIERVKLLAYQYTKSLLDEKVNVIFYDCTTLYFESFIEDDLKQNGYSKDGKFNQSQVLLAIMVTEAGLPVGYELFEGGKFEGHTLDKALKRLHETYKIDKLIFVADAGLISTENIKKFRNNNQPFIVGARLKNVTKALAEKILDKTSYASLPANEHLEEDISYKDIPASEDGLRLIVTYSSKRAAKDKHDRQKAIDSLTKRIARSNNPLSLLNNFGYKKFVKMEGEGKLTPDKNRIAEAEKWDGLHGIITNVERTEAAALLAHYRGLWQVEETFRISKHDLRMRPIFHWNPERIKAHIAICFMSLMCMRVMEYMVRLQYKKLSPAAIKNELMRLQTSILKDSKTGKQYVLPSKATQDAKKIYQILGLKWTSTPYPIDR